MLSTLPKPYDLFTKQTKSDETPKKTPTKEGFENTDDIKKQNTFMGIILFSVFMILAILIGMIYYFNSSILLAGSLIRIYTKQQYWENYKGKMVGSKIVIFLVLWMVVFCLNLFLMDTVFHNNDYSAIFYTTTIYYWTFVGSTILIIGNIPSLVDVFENTIGYMCLKTPFYNLSHTMSMFKNRYVQSQNIKIPNDFLITTFDIPSFHEHFDDLVNQYPTTNEDEIKPDGAKSDFYIDLYSFGKDPNDNQPENIAERPPKNLDITTQNALRARKELLKQVLTKNTIGHFIWVLLASYVTILLTANTIVQ